MDKQKNNPMNAIQKGAESTSANTLEMLNERDNLCQQKDFLPTQMETPTSGNKTIMYEKKKETDDSVTIIRIKGFNVPKKEDNGEDADPFDYVNSNELWGVISVFDGMGGAGGHKYVYHKKKEEHTSAYWASRFVCDEVKKIISEWSSKEVEENPILFIEKRLGQRIKDRLDSESVHFPSESSVKSKMIHKLPTTAAICVYELRGSMAHIVTYWAGDSRIYMFDLEHMSFLTIDDANAPNNDPFSPANMDLSMNNAIWQDCPFRINKFERDIPLEKNKPFVLLACTDGCFGYFKNPIEFEYMVRNELKDATDWVNWSDRMKDAIIQNGQNDDLSLVGVVFGLESMSFDDFKQKMQERLDTTPIFKEYFHWKSDIQSKQDDMKKHIETLKQEISRLSSKIDTLKKNKNDFDNDVQEIVAFLESKSIVPKRCLKKFINAIKKQKEPFSIGKEILTYESQLNDKRENFEKNKIELEEWQEKWQIENNGWYEKYKQMIFYDVKPVIEVYNA